VAIFKLRPSYFVLPLVHLGFCIATARGLNDGQGGWTWFPFFLADFPFSILFLPLFSVFDHPAIVFGIVGTLWWYVVSASVAWLFKALRDASRSKKMSG